MNDYTGNKEKSIINPEGLNIGFKNEEEEFTTVKIGNQMNNKLGEDYRTNYSIIPYSVENATSTKIKPPSNP